MKEEMSALEDNNTFDLVKLPEDKTVVGGRWVYAKKIAPDSRVYRKFTGLAVYCSNLLFRFKHVT